MGDIALTGKIHKVTIEVGPIGAASRAAAAKAAAEAPVDKALSDSRT